MVTWWYFAPKLFSNVSNIFSSAMKTNKNFCESCGNSFKLTKSHGPRSLIKKCWLSFKKMIGGKTNYFPPNFYSWNSFDKKNRLRKSLLRCRIFFAQQIRRSMVDMKEQIEQKMDTPCSRIFGRVTLRFSMVPIGSSKQWTGLLGCKSPSILAYHMKIKITQATLKIGNLVFPHFQNEIICEGPL